MGISTTRIGLVSAFCTVAMVSCTPLSPGDKSPLKPAQMSPDSVVLDVFFVRFPYGDPEVNRSLWEDVDEQHFPPEVRQELLRHGFRVGLVGTQVPVALSRLLQLTDEVPEGLAEDEVTGKELGQEPNVTGWHSQCRAGRRLEIAASGVYDELPVLTTEDRALCGRSYAQAQGILALRPFPEPDGRVRLEIVPELHYGQARQYPVAARGGVRLEVKRPRRVFEKLAVTATLAPGHMILIGSLPDHPGSLGHYFLTQVHAGRREQKLLVVRLSQTQHDGLFAPVDVVQLGEVDE